MEISLRPILKALLLSLTLAGCAAVPVAETLPTANLEESTPINISMDVAPGYRNGLFLEIPDDGILELKARHIRSNASKKWMPSLYVSLDSDESDTRYYFNISVDTDLKKMYVRSRLFDVKEKKELSNRTHQHLYALDHQFHLKANIEKKKVSVYIDGILVDEQELSYEPELIGLGASSGTFNVSLISPPPPPAPD